jgi:RimJ/RimL family protein N-acetyltransferase
MKESILTARLALREMTMEDLPAMREIVQDEKTMYAWGHAWSEEEAIAGIEKQIRSYQERGYGRWAVSLKKTGAVIGMCGLQWCETDKELVPEIGYLFNRAYWRNGYASEAAIACKRRAFDFLGFDEVFSLIRDTNFPSMNVAIRAGMLVRGRFAKLYRGEEMPHYIFSARKREEGAS